MIRSSIARICFALVLSGFTVCVSSGANSQGTDKRKNSFRHLVDIGGGRHLNIVCSGKGSLTVVFLQGFTGDMTNWREIREPVGSFARTCFYDRAGLGYSDPANKPSTAENIVDDLHALLRAAGVKGRVVLVGHSLGGLFATLYADKYKSDLAGMVLVDPSFAGQYNYDMSKADKEIARRDVNQFASSLKTCEKLARDGNLTKDDNHNCFHQPQNLTAAEAEYVAQQFYRPSYYASTLSELENFDPNPDGPFTDFQQERPTHGPGA